MKTLYSKPLVSITIPSYQQGPELIRAIESVLSQSYSNVEIIVSEDPSERSSEKYLKDYIFENKIRYFQNKKRIGRVANYQAAFSKINGLYAVNLDGDDYFINPKFIEKSMDVIISNPNIVLTVSGMELRRNNLSYKIFPNLSKVVEVYDGLVYFKKNIRGEARTNHHFAMIYDVQIARKLGFYLFDISSTDLESFRRIALMGNVATINQESGIWNVSASSESAKLTFDSYFENYISIKNPLDFALKNKKINNQEYKLILKESMSRFVQEYILYALNDKKSWTSIYLFFKLLINNKLFLIKFNDKYWQKVIIHLLIRFCLGLYFYKAIAHFFINKKN